MHSVLPWVSPAIKGLARLKVLMSRHVTCNRGLRPPQTHVGAGVNPSPRMHSSPMWILDYRPGTRGLMTSSATALYSVHAVSTMLSSWAVYPHKRASA